MFRLRLRGDLDRQAEEVDEAGAVRLVIDLVLVEGGDLRIVEGEGGSDSCVDDVALVELELDVAGDGLLRLVDEGGERLAQRREPLAEVYQFRELLRDELLVVLGVAV